MDLLWVGALVVGVLSILIVKYNSNLEHLRTENWSLKSAYDGLSSAFSSSRTSLSELQSQNENLQSQNENLQSQNENLQSQNENLRADNIFVTDNNRALRTDQSVFDGEISALNVRITELEAINKRLKNFQDGCLDLVSNYVKL